MDLTHGGGNPHVVVTQLCEHVERRHVVVIVIEHALRARNITYGPQSHAADLSNTLRDRVGDGEDLISLLVEQKVIVAKMRTGHVPMEVLSLQIERERIGEDQIESTRKLTNFLFGQWIRGLQRSRAPRLDGFSGHECSMERKGDFSSSPGATQQASRPRAP